MPCALGPPPIPPTLKHTWMDVDSKDETQATEELSKVERTKAASAHLRGTIAAELEEATPTFTEEAGTLLKFHGVYQQDDRDRRKEARAKGLDKHHQMMIRTRIPGGVVSPEGYLAHDRIAGEWGNGTLRVTTRQDFQLHGVLKGDLHAGVHAINEALMTTLGGCGDQNRNIMFCPAPAQDRLRGEVRALLAQLVPALTPSTRAYHEIWIDGEVVHDGKPPADETEDLYGESYLPRKFKTALALDGDNCVDVYANDLGLVAIADREGGLAGFNVLVGGGLGRTANKPETFPAIAQPLGFVTPDRAIAVSRAVVAVQRDHGDRANRRHARLKYLVHDRGLDWFRAQVEAEAGFQLQRPRPMRRLQMHDHLGWNQGWYGLYVENGRIEGSLRDALREAVERFRPAVYLTGQQNVLLAGIEDRRGLEAIFRKHGVPLTEEISPTLRNSMACPALPTCGLAVAESERALPGLIRQIEALVRGLGLEDEQISYRMTGCPNGCARPYLGDVGFVGTTLGKYDVYLGGDFTGTRLNRLFARNVRLAEIPALLEGPLSAFGAERQAGEGFGDWCERVGVDSLRERFEEAAG